MPKIKYAYTKNQVIEYFAQRSAESRKYPKAGIGSPLWLGTSEEVIRIVRNNSRKDAIIRLGALRKRYRNMALSGYYVQAIRMLSERVRDRFPYMYREGVEYATPQSHGATKEEAQNMARKLKSEKEQIYPSDFPVSILVSERKGKWYIFSNFTHRNVVFWMEHKRLPKVGEGY